jgi:oligopeptide transport system ATP-binding protein
MTVETMERGQPQPKVPPGAPLLEVRDLKVHFPFHRGGLFTGKKGFVRAVDGISFTLARGETLCLVGESGCGKSTTARAIMNLIPPTSGEVYLAGERIDRLSEYAMRPFRQRMQMIFQDPFASLNPRMPVGKILREPMDIFGLHEYLQRPKEVLRLMDMVGLNPRFVNRYPHEFSGGQRQRIGIARALAVQPELIVCDEPVSALDVSIQAQVINLLQELQTTLGLSYVFIAHDLAVVRHVADRVGVMYLGRIVELGPAEQIYTAPKHPYTQALLSAVPLPDPIAEAQRRRVKLVGEVPSPDKIYPGCAFVDRCPIGEQACRETRPELEGAAHQVACIKVP